MDSVRGSGLDNLSESTLDIGLLRCVADLTGAKGRCLGKLCPEDGYLRCEQCAQRYRVVDGIPVLKTKELSSDDWFERVYLGRSREEEVWSDYLLQERREMSLFLRRFAGRGICLEVGCGVGLFADLVPNYVGLEFALSAMRVKGFENFCRICGDARRIGLASESVAMAFSFNTLEHVPEVEEALVEMDRVLAPRGYLVLRPAWHCSRWQTELIPVRSWSELRGRQKFVKLLLPILRTTLFKGITRVPWRIWRRITGRNDLNLRCSRLVPYQGPEWVADADAAVGLDCHETIFWYLKRGYKCLSHPTGFSQIFARHDLVVLKKGPG
jgi:SAM-dependent methyltransferase